MLSALIWIPVLGAVMIGLWPRSLTAGLARWLALGTAGVTFLWTVVVLGQFNPDLPGMQMAEFLPWFQAIDLNYHLGVDGLSLPLLILNSFLLGIAVFSSDPNIQRPRLYYILVLLLGSGVAGAFLAQNLLLFFLFYEVELIPLYLLIAVWGGPRREYAATKFLLYTAVSGVLILAAFLGMAWLTGSPTFTYETLRTQSSLPLAAQTILLVLLLVAFGIKTPLVPLHTWLPDAHVEASTPVSVLLAGVLLKLGTYGLLRFGLGLFPEAWAKLGPLLAVWAAVSVLYGSFMAIGQKDMKKLVAYSSVGHMGYVLLAAAAATPLSLVGAMAQMVSHGLISGLLFLLVGIVYKKAGTRDLDILQGLLAPERGMPFIGGMMILGVMASAGIPGMAGFVAEFLIFRSSFPIFPVQTLLCIVGSGLTAVYFLLLINRAFFGRLPQRLRNLPRVVWAERAPALVIVALVILFGVQPNWMVHWSVATTQNLIATSPALKKAIPVALDTALRTPR
ncbi:NADH-quinone oxidoreductase subunit M [Anthocerotibacter panamensis]|uniref:NADH-quinone oxidoreductase subunit M n=1 Tax=Anthocerotibacter panamensis TaxID=2857077 RepID=UPI001C404FD9|nr:NADH-quinone oxidoreductase subunit M [Anthocerotibacter panamensis]